MKKSADDRKKTLVEKLLERAPISDEIRDILEENTDLPRQISRDLYTQVLSGSGRLRSEIREAVARKVERYLSSYDLREIIRETLDEYDITVNISLSRKDRD